MFVVFSFSLLLTQLISSAFSSILAHFHTSLLLDLHVYLFVSFCHSCVCILTCIDTVTVYFTYIVTVTFHLSILLLVNLRKSFFFLPLFFAGVQSVAKDKMVSCLTDEDPRLDSLPKCEAFSVDACVMPLGELYRYC